MVVGSNPTRGEFFAKRFNIVALLQHTVLCACAAHCFVCVLAIQMYDRKSRTQARAAWHVGAPARSPTCATPQSALGEALPSPGGTGRRAEHVIAVPRDVNVMAAALAVLGAGGNAVVSGSSVATEGAAALPGAPPAAHVS